MNQILETIPQATKFAKSKIPTDHLPFIFKLHCQFTFWILVSFTILVSTYSYIDSSDSAIQCYNEKKPLPNEDGECDPAETNQILNRYCWISSTFTLPKHFEGIQGEDFIYPGVGTYKKGDERVYHAYYQWVPFVLFFQALCFIAPYGLWKQLVGDKIESLVKDVVGLLSKDDKKCQQKLKQLANYFVSRRKLKSREHQTWAKNFIFCESLNIVNVIGQLFLMNAFLGGEFFKYGLEVLTYQNLNPEHRVDPMAILFPKMTKCIFRQFGPSGTLETIDSLCVLGMNIINEKIFLFLWFWYIILAGLSIIKFCMRLGQWIIPPTRKRLIPQKSRFSYERSSHSNSLSMDLQFGDWLLLYQISQNLEPSNFDVLMTEISKGLNKPKAISKDEEKFLIKSEIINE